MAETRVLTKAKGVRDFADAESVSRKYLEAMRIRSSVRTLRNEVSSA